MADFKDLIPSAPAGRFEGVQRAYSAADVEKLRGSIVVQYSLAERGANKLWELLHSEDYVHALDERTF